MPYKNREKRLKYLKDWQKRNPNYMKNYKKTKEGKKNCRKSELKYRRTRKGKENRKNIDKKRYQKFPKKHKSRENLNRIFREGNITNSEFICAICGKQPVEKHHENYDLSRVFIPLCIKHHHDASMGGV